MATVDRDDRGVRDRLQAALNAIDEAFADPPAVGPVDGCLRCYFESELVLLGGDPWQVPDDLVRQFAEEVQDHWDPEQYGPLWRRLAPRIIRLLVARECVTDLGRLLRGLGPYGAGFLDWPASQQAAIHDVLGAALDIALVDGRRPADVLELLGAVSHLGHDVTPWTDRIDTLTGPYADAGLVRLVCHWAVDLLWGDEPLFWWWHPDDPIALGTRWVCSPAVHERVRRFAATHPHCKTAADTLVAIDELSRGGVSPWFYPTCGYDRAQNSGLRDLIHLL